MRKGDVATATAINHYVLQQRFLETLMNARTCTLLVVALHTLGVAHTFRGIKAIMSRCVSRPM